MSTFEVDAGGAAAAACPFCGYSYDRASHVGGNPASRREPPAAGDVSLCVHCGQLAVFTGRGLAVREPTDLEKSELYQDPEVVRVVTSWLDAKSR